MAIDFVCLFCGTKYHVPDTSAGRRARCKTCQRSMTVPGDAPAAAAGGRPEVADLIPESAVVVEVPDVAAVASSIGARAKAKIWLQRLERVRPRSAPAWVAAVILVALVVGLLSDYVALFDLFVLGSVGALALLVALGWGLLTGLANGSARLTAMFATAPTIAVVWLALRVTVVASKQSAKQQIPIGQLMYYVAFALSFVFMLLAFALGLATNPRAFKRPALLALAGGVALGTCWLPMLYRASSVPQVRSPSPIAAPTGGPFRRPPGMPGPPTRPPLVEVAPRPGTPRNRRPTARRARRRHAWLRRLRPHRHRPKRASRWK
jgi:hypothetical protein